MSDLFVVARLRKWLHLLLLYEADTCRCRVPVLTSSVNNSCPIKKHLSSTMIVTYGSGPKIPPHILEEAPDTCCVDTRNDDESRTRKTLAKSKRPSCSTRANLLSRESVIFQTDKCEDTSLYFLQFCFYFWSSHR